MTALTISRDDFCSALAIAGGVIEKRNVIPVLTTALIRANGHVEVVGTDLDIQITARIPVAAERAGSFLLADAQRMAKAIKQIKGDADSALSLEAGAIEKGADRQRVTISGDNMAVTAETSLSVDDFPDIPVRGEPIVKATLGSDFAAALARLLPAVSTEETRYCLNGICFHHVAGWTFALEATDGHRLFFAHVELPDCPAFTDRMIVPRRALPHIIDALRKGGSGGRLELYGAKEGNAPTLETPARQLSLDTGDRHIITKLIDGTFPDVGRVVPQNAEPLVECDTSELRAAIKAVAAAVPRKCRAVKIVPNVATGALMLSTYSPEGFGGTATVAAQIDARLEHVLNGHIGFNASYLIDAIDALSGERVQFCWPNPGTAYADPCLMLNPADATFRVVQMPMRV